jgi:small subunit ribosomal protein S6
MAIYETVGILNSLLPPKEIDDIIERTQQMITENGGKVRTVDKWGKRRLAYEIQKKQYGFYFAIEFEGDGNIPLALQSENNFNDNVLRYLTYSYDKHKIKAMAQKKEKLEAQAEAVVLNTEADAKKVEDKPVKPEQTEKEEA